MTNGVFMSNAQNYAFLIGMAWFPFVLQASLSALKNPTWRASLELALVSFMFIAGSYPGVVIIGVYVLLGIALAYFVRQYVQFDFLVVSKKLRLFIFKCAIPVAVACAFPLVASIETYNEITRTAGLNEKRLNENPFPPKAYISILTPYAVGTTNNVEWGSDFSMINFFMGLPFIIGIIAWLLNKKKNSIDFGYLAIAVFLMIAALGALTPLRMWLAHLPAMGLFRHPSIFRFIAVTFFILIAARGLSTFFMHKHKKKAIILGLSVLPFLIILALNLSSLSLETPRLVLEEFQSKDGLPKVSLHARMAFQALIFTVLISLLFFAQRPKMMAIIGVLSAAIAIQLNVYSTMVGNFLVARENKKLEQVIENREAYQGEAIAKYHTDSIHLGIPFVWRNEGIYLRKPSWDGYNSFIFSRYNQLEESGKLLYFKDKPLIFSSLDSSQSTFSNWHIFTNKISCEVSAASLDKIVLLQTWLPMWKAKVDGVPVEIEIYDDAFPAIQINKGTHSIELEYVPEKTIAAGVISIAAFLFLFIFAWRFAN